MITLAVLAASALVVQVQSVDTAQLRRELRRATQRYENISRSRAPWGSGRSAGCDEYVGRFCLWYGEDGAEKLPEEPPVVNEARDSVIRVFERAMMIWPTDTTVAAPLVRFHIEGDSMAAAERVSLSFARFGGDPLWAGMLQGLAAHESGRSDIALEHFERASLLLPERERRHAWDIKYIIDPSERNRLEALSTADRAHYEHRLWSFADPLFLTPGNEARAEHFARYVWGRIVRRAPLVHGAVSWGDDVDELTRRYGPPRARSRSPGSGFPASDNIAEHFDPDQLTLTPPRLLKEGIPQQPPPPDRWPLDTLPRRSGFAARTTRSLGPLQHQVSRFHDGDSVLLRVDAVMPLDTLAMKAPGRLVTGVFVFDTAFHLLASDSAPGVLRADTLVLSLRVRIPGGTPVIYSVEAMETVSRLSARSRYLLDPLPVTPPLLSDLVIVRPPPQTTAIRAAEPDALGQLIVSHGERLGIFLEVDRLDDVAGVRRLDVRLEILEASEPSALNRLGRFFGRLFGRSPTAVPVTTWSEEFAMDEPAQISNSLDLGNISPGLKLLRLTVADRAAGTSAVRERAVLIAKPD